MRLVLVMADGSIERHEAYVSDGRWGDEGAALNCYMNAARDHIEDRKWKRLRFVDRSGHVVATFRNG